jgi:uncharacterized Tic20 family protein
MSENINPIPPIQPPPNSQARTWNMLCHLSALAGFLGIPFGNVLGPLIVWLIKKNEFPSVDAHGKAALNFQLTVVIATMASVIAGFILAVICVGFIFFILAGAILICGMVFGVIAAIKANNGEEYKYPYSLDLIK